MESLNNEILSAQLVPVRKGERGGLEVFMGLRKTKSFYGQWCCPGGRVDEGETLKQAAARELEEEAGAVIMEACLESLRETVIENRDRVYRVQSYLLDGTDLELSNNSPDEHFRMLWMPVDFVFRRHLRKIERGASFGTIPAKLSETILLLDEFKDLPINRLAEALKTNYGRFE